MLPRARLRVAVLPFTLRGAPPEAWPAVAEALAAVLPRRGLELVDRVSVVEQLRRGRLRDTSLLTRREMAALAAALGADRLLLGAIYRFDGGETPAVSLSGRLIDPSHLGVEAMTFTVLEGRTLLGPLGTGGPVTRERTLEVAARRFAVALVPTRAGMAALERDDLLKSSLLAPSPAAFMSARLPARGIRSIIVLPFRNNTRHPAAGQAAADLTSWCLLTSSRLALFDAGDATRRLLERGWRTGMPVGRAEVVSLGLDPAADAILMGSVERWEEGAAAERPPEIAFSMRLLDARSGDILWATEHERRGDQARLLYEAGNVRLAEALMARAAFEALEPLLRALAEGATAAAEPHGAPAAGEGEKP
jgi:TolB-like protein